MDGVKTGVEIGMTRPQAKKRLQPPEGQRCKELTLLSSGGNAVLGHPDFILLSSVTVR